MAKQDQNEDRPKITSTAFWYTPNIAYLGKHQLLKRRDDASWQILHENDI